MKSSAFFFFGFLLLVFKWGFVGGVIQLYSIFLLFRSFFPIIFRALYTVPVLGSFLRNNRFC